MAVCLLTGAGLTARYLILEALRSPERARFFYYNYVACSVGKMLLHHRTRRGAVRVLETDARELIGPEDFPVTLFGFDNSPYTVSPTELLILGSVVRKYGPRRIVEFGTYLGNATLHLAANATDRTRLYTVDLPPDSTDQPTFDLSRNDQAIVGETARGLGARFRNTPFATRITQILADSASYDYRKLEDAFDLIFIDASHTYQYVRADTEAALDVVAPGGFIFWHDYVSPLELPDVFRYLNELGSRLELRHLRGTRLVYYRHPGAAFDEVDR